MYLVCLDREEERNERKENEGENEMLQHSDKCGVGGIEESFASSTLHI